MVLAPEHGFSNIMSLQYPACTLSLELGAEVKCQQLSADIQVQQCSSVHPAVQSLNIILHRTQILGGFVQV